MWKRKDITGKRFGRLVVMKPTEEKSTNGSVIWQCLCDCGCIKHISLSELGKGKIKSCGCLRKDKDFMSKVHIKHGHTSNDKKTGAYLSWIHMKQRCYYTKTFKYENYGGRGITVCDRWKDSFENFLADMGERPEGLSLDRIDNDGNYEPSNCRWSTRSEQNKNRRPRRNHG